MFTKGQRVNLIRNWDGKGTFFVTSAVVYSCGKKKMVLTNEKTGEELGRNFLPSRFQYNFALVVDVSEDANAVAAEQAALFIEYEIARYERILSNPAVGSAAYIKAIEEDLKKARAFVVSVVFK